MNSNSIYYRCYLKPIIDRTFAAFTLMLCAPLLVGLAVAVPWRLGAPFLFTQVRPGKGGRLFRLRKFRTMTDARDSTGQLLPDAERLTPFGCWLRSTSLDELPQLWNVLRGEMSLVGPRPLLEEYLPLYTTDEARRHAVLPGITGWAQVSGRNAITWDEKLNLDAWYVEHCSFWLDAKIILMSFLRVLHRDGVTADNHATSTTLTEQRRSVVVLGAGGHAKVVISTLRAAHWVVVAAYDDDPQKAGRQILGVEICGTIADAELHGNRRAVVAIGAPQLRSSIASLLPLEWVAEIHPASTVDSSVVIGAGTIVCAGAVIQPDARIGRHAIINTSSSVDHDCRIGDFAHIGPGVRLAGGVRVGDHAQLGIGCCVLPGIVIGRNTVVGAGAVVTHDLPEGVIAVGCPAKIVKSSSHAQAAA